jgi:DNA relaxase NicK
MKFDWYQTSIPGVPHDVIMATIQRVEMHGDWEEIQPLKNYHSAAAFVIGSETRCKINFGGHNDEHGANVLASGSAAQPMAEIIRANFPSHRVSRLDACEDFHHSDAYDWLRAQALKIAKVQRVQCREIVKPLEESDDGRTLYLGSQTSAVSMRIYEKGKQLGCSPDWVRAELQVRPQKQQKQLAAYLSPTEVWGMSKWSQAMAVQLGKKGLQRVEANVFQPSDDDRMLRWMLKQYGPLLRRMLALHGSPEALGAQIAYDLDHLDLDPEKASLRPVKEV